MAARPHILRFWTRRQRHGRSEDRETELTLNYPAVVLAGLTILAVLAAAGIIPAEMLGKLLAKLLAM